MSEIVRITDGPDAVRRPENQRRKVEVKTANYTVTSADADNVLEADAAGSGVTFTLPTNPGDGFQISFVKRNATTDLTVTAPAGFSIHYGTAGGSYRNITDANQAANLTLVLRGTVWVVASQFGTWAAV